MTNIEQARIWWNSLPPDRQNDLYQQYIALINEGDIVTFTDDNIITIYEGENTPLTIVEQVADRGGAIGGFAPGDYYNICSLCGKIYMGAKYSIECRECATNHIIGGL